MAKVWAHPADIPLLGRATAENDAEIDSDGDFLPVLESRQQVCSSLGFFEGCDLLSRY